MRLLRILSIFVITTLSLASQASESVQIGVVDMQQAFFKSQVAVDYMEKSKKHYQPKLEALAEERDRIQKSEEKLKKNALTLSKKELEKQQASLEKEKQDFIDQLQKIRQEKNAADISELKKLEPQLKKAVQNVAETGKYSLVLDKAVVLYQRDSTNITSKVIKELDHITKHANKEKTQ